MKSILNHLFFDKELVKKIKTNKTNEHLLYNHLISGKITLREYLMASKA